jgi:FAD/FMN-containing dehydrogenase
MPTRRAFLRRTVAAGTGLALLPYASPRATAGVVVNDIHSQLNRTTVDRVVAIDSEAMLRAALTTARAEGKAICTAGGRHAMGGQQFARAAVLIDTRPMDRIIQLDRQRGIVEVEAGIQWPALIDGLLAMQQGQDQAWSIIQKQTGVDRLTLGGALGANIHGRGLTLKPIIGDIESFTLMDANGNLRTCSRTENTELFRLAIGGYGLFGVVTRVRLRLSGGPSLSASCSYGRSMKRCRGSSSASRKDTCTGTASSRPIYRRNTFSRWAYCRATALCRSMPRCRPIPRS